VWAQAGFRPVDPAVAADFRNQFPLPTKLWTIADLGGWATVDPQLFDKNNGSITKIYTKATG
jgi:ABC-type sulfate transport system substrate-binding protein